jgi:rhodanese-related sulfurtransferase
MLPLALLRDRTGLFTWLLALLVAAAVYASQSPSVTHASVDEARMLIDAGAMVIDVREPAAAANSHIPGARRIPLEALSAGLPGLAAERDRTIVVYCGSGAGRGPRATALLNKAGFSKAVNLESGFEGWRAAGLPVRRG